MKNTGKLLFRTVFLSDVHLGTAGCKIIEVNHFIKNIVCEKLVLNGDIIDSWSLLRRGGWRKAHTRFVRLILKKVEKENTEVLYLRGNHDDLLARFLPLHFGKLKILNEAIHEGVDRRYLIVHGDGFDAITTNHKWLANFGDRGYQSLLTLNRVYNRYRAWRGKEYYSLSRAIKMRVKSAVSFVGKYEIKLKELARSKECNGIICGHIHTPADKQIDDVHYLNSGDWVESLTAIVEHLDGRMEVIDYPTFCRWLKEERLSATDPALTPDKPIPLLTPRPASA